jgi:hypothetical protein
MSTAHRSDTIGVAATIDLDAIGPTPMSALSLIDDTRADMAERLRTAGTLNQAGGLLARLGSSLQSAAHEQLAEIARGFLDIDVVDVLVQGFVKLKELVDAGRSTRTSPDSVAVDLAGHQFRLTGHPVVDLLLGEEPVMTVPFTIQLDLTVQALSATVERGAIVRFTSGTVEAVVSLASGSAQLASGRRTFDPRITINLGNGVRIPDPTADPPNGEVSPGPAS